jgi:hypothetical protein
MELRGDAVESTTAGVPEVGNALAGVSGIAEVRDAVSGELTGLQKKLAKKRFSSDRLDVLTTIFDSPCVRKGRRSYSSSSLARFAGSAEASDGFAGESSLPPTVMRAPGDGEPSSGPPADVVSLWPLTSMIVDWSDTALD